MGVVWGRGSSTLLQPGSCNGNPSVDLVHDHLNGLQLYLDGVVLIRHVTQMCL